MIDPAKLLSDLKRWVPRLEADLRERCSEHPEVDATFREGYTQAREAQRTAHPYETWRDQELTQVAVAWVLATVFVRFLEDNGLIDTACISGPGERRADASHQREQWFRSQPLCSDADYLRHTFTTVASLPGMADLFDNRHNPLWQASISGDAAGELIQFWRGIDEASGSLVHDFSDPTWSTRFLGDLYQNLSEAARDRFALLQTPDFVEQFILDRTLEPAVQSFGYAKVRIIDPACGSGHFLLGAFERMLRHWRQGDTRLSTKEVARHALASIHGVDINPFAIAIARFRLLLEAWRYCGIRRLREAPAFSVKLAVGDSLFHGPIPCEVASVEALHLRTVTANTTHGVEDAHALADILGQKYHAVVANPPYITVKDKALNQAYRGKFKSCYKKYSMAAPFMELIFDLAIRGDARERRPAGYTGQITANSFMKREFGPPLVEHFLPRWDLTHVLDTSGCYIPGHGTPTVILFGRNQPPLAPSIRTVLGIKGEPATPANPAQGLVWTAILNQIDQPGSTSEWVSAADSERSKFHKHPWSIGGGGAAELKDAISQRASITISKLATDVGITAVTGEDDLYLWPEKASPLRHKIEEQRTLVTGDFIRHWSSETPTVSTWLYNCDFQLICLSDLQETNRILWPCRSSIRRRKRFGTPMLEKGLTWYEWQELYQSKLKTPLSITFASVATHNHFVLDRGGKTFNRSAPVIKLPANATEADHLTLLGLLNSSTACFWMKQVFHCKGSTVDQKGARQTTDQFENFYDHDGTKLKQFPIPAERPLALPTELDSLAQQLAAAAPAQVLQRWAAAGDGSLSEHLLASAQQSAAIRARMIALQEELDWQCYRLYGLTEAREQLEWPEARLEALPELQLGERAFEILMARAMEAGELESTWFSRHAEAGSRPTTELPAHWPADYRALVERRFAAIAENRSLELIERPEYKRRWNTEAWAKRQQEALRQWLLTRLESFFHDADRMVEAPDEATRSRIVERLRPARAAFPAGLAPALCSTRQLASAAELDAQWMEAAAAYTSNPAFDVAALVRELVEREGVPYLPAQRYRESGLRHRVQWERTWELQRQEDAVEARVRKENPSLSEPQLKALIRDAQLAEVGDIPVPPKYSSKDFAKTSYWTLRGKLDVPKERWILYPGAERSTDPSPVIAWAGWNHRDLMQALGAWYYERQNQDGWEPARLAPMLAGMKDLLPWLRQWHPGIDPVFHQDLGDFYAGFIRSQCQELNLTEDDLDRERMGV